MDCNLKKMSDFFKFLLCILKKSIKINYCLFYLGKILNVFPVSYIETVNSKK